MLKKHEEVGPLGGGSDYTGFVNFLGIASLDMGFSQTPEHSYATYHSNFDSIAWMNRFGDPTYEHFVAAAQVSYLFKYAQALWLLCVLSAQFFSGTVTRI